MRWGGRRMRWGRERRGGNEGWVFLIPLLDGPRAKTFGRFSRG